MTFFFHVLRMKFLQRNSIQSAIFKLFMEIQEKHHLTNGEFFITDEFRHKLALLTYAMIDETHLLIQHTEVSKKLVGQGIGKRLVEATVLYARRKKLTIVPQCPYAKSVFTKTPEYADVLETPYP
jgi:uncharacterized protein